MAISQPFLLRQYGQGKCLLRYSRTKKRISRLQKQEVQTVQTLTHFCKAVNPWLWSKNLDFFKLFFLGNIRHENVFYDILAQKNALVGYKKKKFKKSKN